MKNNNSIGTIIVQSALIIAPLFIVISCDNNKKPEDTKEVAKDQNEEMFDNTSKEKDALFLVNAAEINLEEIQMGQLAQQKSKMSDIKEFGKMLEDAHRISLDDLTILANKKSIIIPTSLTDNAQEAYNKLLNAADIDFDKLFCDMMVSGHKDAITKFDKASVESKDHDIKVWATATLPSLHSHLEQAVMCQKNNEFKK